MSSFFFFFFFFSVLPMMPTHVVSIPGITATQRVHMMMFPRMAGAEEREQACRAQEATEGICIYINTHTCGRAVLKC
jgi:hypothetical protein